MAASNKIECACTSKDVRAQECAMISKFGSDINSMDASDINNLNKIPLEAQPTQFCSQKDDKEVLVTALNQYTEKICKDTFLDGNGEKALLKCLVEIYHRSQRKTH